MRIVTLAIIISAALLATSARAEEEWVHPDSHMAWGFFETAGEHKEDIYVQMLSENRPSKMWGPYVIHPLNEGTGPDCRRGDSGCVIDIECKENEKICFGAWNNSGAHWGLGKNGGTCSNCCRYCDGRRDPRHLIPLLMEWQR